MIDDEYIKNIEEQIVKDRIDIKENAKRVRRNHRDFKRAV